MKVVILAGGLPSMLYDTYEMAPKPMAEIGGRPILWHAMKHYAAYGYNEFIICTGYRSDLIKDYFLNYYIYQSDVTVDLYTNEVEIHNKKTEDWKVSVIDTGMYTGISERILKIKKYLNGESFLVSYGDCVSDIDVSELVSCHQAHQGAATMALTAPSGRNRALPVDMDGCLTGQEEMRRDTWVDANIMVMRPEVFEYLRSDVELLKPPLFNELLAQNKLKPYFHRGFWAPMETRRDQAELERMWDGGSAPWKNWKD